MNVNPEATISISQVDEHFTKYCDVGHVVDGECIFFRVNYKKMNLSGIYCEDCLKKAQGIASEIKNGI